MTPEQIIIIVLLSIGIVILFFRFLKISKEVREEMDLGGLEHALTLPVTKINREICEGMIKDIDAAGVTKEGESKFNRLRDVFNAKYKQDEMEESDECWYWRKYQQCVRGCMTYDCIHHQNNN